MLDNIEAISREYLCQRSWYDNGRIGYPFCSSHSLNMVDWNNYARGIIQGRHNPLFIADSPLIRIGNVEEWVYIRARIRKHRVELFEALKIQFLDNVKLNYISQLALKQCNNDSEVWKVIYRTRQHISHLNFDTIGESYPEAGSMLKIMEFDKQLANSFIDQILICGSIDSRPVDPDIETIINDLIDSIEEYHDYMVRIILIYKAIKYIKKYGNNNILDRLVEKVRFILLEWNKNV